MNKGLSNWDRVSGQGGVFVALTKLRGFLRVKSMNERIGDDGPRDRALDFNSYYMTTIFSDVSGDMGMIEALVIPQNFLGDNLRWVAVNFQPKWE